MSHEAMIKRACERIREENRQKDLRRLGCKCVPPEEPATGTELSDLKNFTLLKDRRIS